MNEPHQIQLMIVDDHPVVRGGLTYALLAFEDIEVVGEADSGEEALRLCGRVQPDVVLMDLVMSGMGGAATTRAIRERYPHVQVVVLTNYQEKQMVREVLQAGAIGYLLKGVSLDELAGAIRAAYAGRPTFAPEVARVLIENADPAQNVGQDLTERQLEVLALVVQGLSNIEIAERLVVSVSTARHHVSQILAKLGASNRAEAAALAVRHGLVKGPNLDDERPYFTGKADQK